jgi:hypothetical protein
MFDLGDSLQDALGVGHRRLAAAQGVVARANSGKEAGRSADAAMAQTAAAAIFCEALLAAEHARFEEIKTVTR